MALLPNSPAIDYVYGGSTGQPTTDQRGYVRPFGDYPDSGAFEYGSHLAVQPVLPVLTITYASSAKSKK